MVWRRRTAQTTTLAQGSTMLSQVRQVRHRAPPRYTKCACGWTLTDHRSPKARLGLDTNAVWVEELHTLEKCTYLLQGPLGRSKPELPTYCTGCHRMYVCRKVKNSQARTGHQRGMGGRKTDDDDTHERHTDTNKLTRHTGANWRVLVLSLQPPTSEPLVTSNRPPR